MSAILTINSRVKMCYDFSHKNLYFGIGRTETEWTDPDTPDVPIATATTIEELSFIKKVGTKKYVIPDAGGEISFRDTKWTEIQEADIYTQQARYLFLQIQLNYDEVPLIDYRQIGILEDPIDSSSNIVTGDYYLASDLSSQGFLHYIDNRKVVTRTLSQYEVISIIIEF